MMFRCGDRLKALMDVRTVRTYLEERQVDFSKWARRNGTSWTETATALGMTPQAAWDRWDQLDDGLRKASDCGLRRHQIDGQFDSQAGDDSQPRWTLVEPAPVLNCTDELR